MPDTLMSGGREKTISLRQIDNGWIVTETMFLESGEIESREVFHRLRPNIDIDTSGEE